MPARHPQSFWTSIRYDAVTGCWNWTGWRNERGYAKVWYLGKMVWLHRLSAHFYLRFDLRSKLHVLHKCDNPSCFNPKHLFIGTHQDNMQDATNKGRMGSDQRTHCRRGHALTPENLYARSNGERGTCKECCRVRYQKKRLRIVG